MATNDNAIGMIELSSIGVGYLVQDAMLKAANVDLLLGRTICSGKYINVVGGSVGPVRTAVEVGVDAAPDGVIDQMVIPSVHPGVFPAVAQSVELDGPPPPAVGIVETYSAACVLEAADAAAKAARITLLRIHLAMALGGKAYLLMTGSVADCRSGVDAAARIARAKGLLVSEVVISGPRKELLSEYI